MTASHTTALVLFSGGQDSTVCLAYALQNYDRVETFGVDYGQRHGVELEQRQTVRSLLPKLAEIGPGELGEDHLIEVPSLKALGETAMTHDVCIEAGETGLPTTFVPGRNLMFLVLAGALAWRRGITALVGGMCETDYSGYPDCRRETIDAQEAALRLGLGMSMVIETPLMYLNKAETWALADELGGSALVDLIVERTHTCYLGDRSQRHDWGYGCGTCPACALRAGGWQAWRAGGA